MLLDTDTLSEVMKGRDGVVRTNALTYLAEHGRFTFSIITRYEILRGLTYRAAERQLAAFEARCRDSIVLPLSDDVVRLAAQLYADLRRGGHVINDADILIAATALTGNLALVTGNQAHYAQIPGLRTINWRG